MSLPYFSIPERSRPFNDLPVSDTVKDALHNNLEKAAMTIAHFFPWSLNTETIIIHSANRISGTPQKGKIAFPRPSGGSSYNFIRLVTFCCANHSSSTPSTSDINSARTGILLRVADPGITTQQFTAHAETRKGQFFIPLTGAIDHERVSFVHRRWIPTNHSIEGLHEFSIEWATAPNLVSDTWNLEWWAEFEVAWIPWS